MNNDLEKDSPALAGAGVNCEEDSAFFSSSVFHYSARGEESQDPVEAAASARTLEPRASSKSTPKDGSNCPVTELERLSSSDRLGVNSMGAIAMRSVLEARQILEVLDDY